MNGNRAIPDLPFSLSRRGQPFGVTTGRTVGSNTQNIVGNFVARSFVGSTTRNTVSSSRKTLMLPLTS